MKKYLIILLAVLFVGCDTGLMQKPVYVTTIKDTPSYSAPQESPENPEEEIIVKKMLAPIDETKIYIWDDFNKCMYLADDLPSGKEPLNPTPFLYTDGTVADVVAFEFYKPDRHFYLKVRDMEEVKTDGITTGWNEIYRTFRQINGKMTETDNPVFPAYAHETVTEYEYPGFRLGPTPDHWWVFFPTDEWGIRMGYCSYPMKYFSKIIKKGDNVWVIAEKRDVDHPQLFLMGEACDSTRWMDYAKAVYKY